MTTNPKWTLEEVKAENDRALATDPSRLNDPTLPLFQWFAFQSIEQCEKRFNAGDKFALMHAIQQCAMHGLIIPDWAARAYCNAFYGVTNLRVKSWDDTFGRPYQKGMNLNAKRKQRTLKFAVYICVIEILNREPGTAIDAQLFERVGADFCLGKTLAEKYYYLVKNSL